MRKTNNILVRNKLGPLLVALLAVYLVKADLPALAYFSASCFAVIFVLRISCLRFETNELGFAVTLLSFIVYLLLSGGAYDSRTFAFALNLACSLIVLLCLLTFNRKTDWLRFSKDVFFLFVILAIFDTYYKFAFPLVFDANIIVERDFYEIGFYQYKGSFFYKDSNGLAYLLIPVVALGFEVRKLMMSRGLPVSKSLWFILCCLPTALVILTFSRAAMVTALLLDLLYILRIRAVVIVLTGLGALFAKVIYGYVENDLSGGTKLDEITAVYSYYKYNKMVDLLFGMGFGNGDAWTGRYIHGALQKIFLELGILGLSIYLWALFFILRIRGCWRALVGLLLMGFSSNFYFLPAFVVSVLFLIGRLNASTKRNVEIV